MNSQRADVIVVASSQGAVEANKVVKKTPVVFVGVSDPVTILYNPEGAVEPRVAEAHSAIRSLDLVPIPVEMRDLPSLEKGFAAMRGQHADAMLVVTAPPTLRYRDAIVKGAADNRLPAVCEFAEFARAGGLVGYSASIPALFVCADESIR